MASLLDFLCGRGIIMPKAKLKKGKRALAVPYARGFRPPSAKRRCGAARRGREEGEGRLGREYEPSTHFAPVPAPSSVDDWLAQYNEEGQTYTQFLKENPWLSSRKVKYCQMTFRPDGKTLLERYPEGKIYLLPLGDEGDNEAPDFAHLADYTSRFFELPVEVLPAVELSVNIHKQEVLWVESTTPPDPQEGRGTTSTRRKSYRPRLHRLEARFHAPSGRYQLQGSSVLMQVRSVMPKDALCLMALTVSDLYDTPPDLFVAGLAGGNHRVGVFSLKRYAPSLAFSTEHWHQMWHASRRGQGSGGRKEEAKILLQRSCKLLVHEVSHLLGVDHCIWYSCCMNGSGHLAEDFRQPSHLCPVDLRKLQQLCGFDMVRRYGRLGEFYTAHGLEEERQWVERRVSYISDITSRLGTDK